MQLFLSHYSVKIAQWGGGITHILMQLKDGNVQ